MADQPGMAWKAIAASAYKAWMASAAPKMQLGAPVMEFSELPEPMQVAWEAAVRQAVFCSTVMPSEPTPLQLDEKRWANWKPPR